MSGEGRESGGGIIDKGTLVPVGIAISIIVVAVGCTWWLHDAVDSFRHDNTVAFAAMSVRIDELGNKVKWTFLDQIEWEHQLQKRNPKLDVPSAIEIRGKSGAERRANDDDGGRK